MSEEGAAQPDYQPLLGWRILTTRAKKQSGHLAEPLRDLGAEVIEVPTIEITPPSSYEPLDSALKNIRDYEWLVLTSVNGVDAVFQRLQSLEMSAANLAHLEIAAIGPATQKEIEKRGLKVAVTPEKYIAESVVEALHGKTEGKRVLLARAKVARDILPSELRKAGVLLEVVEAYETKVPAAAQAKLKKLFSGRHPAAGYRHFYQFLHRNQLHQFAGQFLSAGTRRRAHCVHWPGNQQDAAGRRLRPNHRSPRVYSSGIDFGHCGTRAQIGGSAVTG